MAVQLTEFKRTSRDRLEKQVAAAEALRALVRELLVQQVFLRHLALGHAAQDRGLRGTVLLQVGFDDRLDVRVRARQETAKDLPSPLDWKLEPPPSRCCRLKGAPPAVYFQLRARNSSMNAWKVASARRTSVAPSQFPALARACWLM